MMQMFCVNKGFGAVWKKKLRHKNKKGQENPNRHKMLSSQEQRSCWKKELKRACVFNHLPSCFQYGSIQAVYSGSAPICLGPVGVFLCHGGACITRCGSSPPWINTPLIQYSNYKQGWLFTQYRSYHFQLKQDLSGRLLFFSLVKQRQKAHCNFNLMDHRHVHPNFVGYKKCQR